MSHLWGRKGRIRVGRVSPFPFVSKERERLKSSHSVSVGKPLVEFSVSRPAFITVLMVVATAVFALLGGLPSLWPSTFSFLHPLVVDTDPENMLPEDEPVRVFHDTMKEKMSLHDMVIVGVVNESHPQGVFNPGSLKRIHQLTEFAKTLIWEDEANRGEKAGVIEVDVIAPSTVDSIEQAGLGSVRFEWLMEEPPRTDEEAQAVREKAERIPFLDGTLISEDGRALCIYLPLTHKSLSYRVYARLREKIESLGGDDQYYITGLPVAEDTFGVEMFKQMAISAPLAMLIIFLLLLLFFRKLVLILSPMIVAVVAVICTMGLLIATGNTVHIMSSMIPIFIMPIAVLDAVHILSEFFDRYQESRDRRKTILGVMDTLFMPMLYTSLTTAAGFASLALTPIPPVQIFGLFIAFGVLLAWILTVTFIPAYVMFIKESSLESFGASQEHHDEQDGTYMARFLARVGRLTYRRAKLVMTVTLILSVIAVYGVTQIQINDNPIKWFTPSHPIRVADQVLNEHFGGTYMAFLTLSAEDAEENVTEYVEQLADRLRERGQELAGDLPNAPSVFEIMRNEAVRRASQVDGVELLLEQLVAYAEEKFETASDETFEAWDEALVAIELEKQRDQVFKDPGLLRYVADLQTALQKTDVVGKSNSLADIVKTVHRELLLGEENQFRIPETNKAVAQCLFTYQNSHRKDDLWHFVTKDYRQSVLWIQLRSGDNKDMVKVVEGMRSFLAAHPPPKALRADWFGLTYINVVWQEKMVNGMLQAFLGSFLIVLLMMTLLYRSSLWGLLSMIPLTVTIGIIYGAIGLIGKDYDMPVAVLSALSLGLAVDYAIHFLSRSRELRERRGSWRDAAAPVFGEPARAIARNVVVIGLGFLPLLAAPLMPYKTVGIFIAAILITAGVASLFILPAMITLLERWLFPETRLCCVTCNCVTYFVSTVTMVALIAVNAKEFFEVRWSQLSLYSLIAVLVLAMGCFLLKRREACKAGGDGNKKGETK